MAENFDVIVIGAGPAGYVAAIRCAQLGLNTACIDEWQRNGEGVLGGTCLNVGCIPSKALLESAALYASTQHKLGEHGISVGKTSIDIKTMQSRKDAVVKKLTGGIAQLFKANKVTAVYGKARLLAGKNVSIVDRSTNEVTQTLSAKNIIIATGSTPVELKSMMFDHKSILDSEDLLALKSVPKKLVIVGAGVIGLELGSVWNSLGADVTLLEAMDSFLPMLEPQISREASRVFKKQGLKIELGAMVKSAKKSGKAIAVEYEQKGDTHTIKTDKLAVLVGRKPNTAGLLAPDSGVDLDDKGRISVDKYCETSEPGVWAVGDVVRGLMLAHKGSEEGVHVAETIAGKTKHALDHDVIPSVIYTHPEISWVGQTEAELKASGTEYVSANFPFAASGRALASGEAGGQVKVISDAKTDRILGVYMIGEHTSEILAEAVFAMQYQASAEDLGRTIHGHPTLSEALKEAALGISKSAIHKVN
ncbi:MAG: dihydrolipoamide dehydrogenase [Saprospiraceae bacterium]|jgi:dihydrolipoamide dehydrogenase